MALNHKSGNTDRNLKPKRKKTKRTGPLPLQWITITDPADSNRPENRELVRSHVMIKYRQEHPHPPTANDLQNWVIQDDLPLEVHGSLAQDDCRSAPTLSSLAYHNVPDDRSLAVKLCDRSVSIVTDYEDSEQHETRMMATLEDHLVAYHIMDNGFDNLSPQLPRFQNCGWDAEVLIRRYVRMFATETTILKWVPSMLLNDRLILGWTILASSWMDMQAGCSGASRRTEEIMSETKMMLNQLVGTESGEATLVTILHVLAGDMWNCNERLIRLHESGVAAIIDSVESKTVAEVAAACCFHCDIVCEVEQLPVFQDWKPRDPLKHETASLLESPLFGRASDLKAIANDPRCSAATFGILRDVGDLTDLVLEQDLVSRTTTHIKEEDEERTSLFLQNYSKRVSGIHDRLASLPSAYSSGHEMSNDWVYEACRIAALIYTTAIASQVPFSVAADPSQYRDASNSNSTAGSDVTKGLLSVLQETDCANIWGDMAGVFYWVCAVGAAASRTPTAISASQQLPVRNKSDPLWVRRCLVMHSMRAMFLLVFRHATPMIMAEKSLLRVQKFIGTYDVKTPLSRPRPVQCFL